MLLSFSLTFRIDSQLDISTLQDQEPMIDTTVTRLQIELTDSTTKEVEVRKVKENAIIVSKNK